MNRQDAIRTTMLSFANEPFKYGTLDCCLFAAKVAEQITGIDYSAGFDNYTEDDAAEYISEAGSLSDLVSKLLNRTPVDPDQLAIGDPVLVRIPVIGDVIGIVSTGSVIVKSNHGAMRINLDRAVHGWSLDG